MIRPASLLLAAVTLAACMQSDHPLGPAGGPATSAATVNAAATHFRSRQVFTDDLMVSNPCSGENICRG